MYGWVQLPILARQQEPELEQKQVNEGGSGKSESGESFIKLLFHPTPRPSFGSQPGPDFAVFSLNSSQAIFN